MTTADERDQSPAAGPGRDDVGKTPPAGRRSKRGRKVPAPRDGAEELFAEIGDIDDTSLIALNGVGLLKGLADSERVFREYRFDGLTFGVVRGQTEVSQPWFRTVQLITARTKKGPATYTARPLFNGSLAVASVYHTASVDRGGDLPVVTDQRLDEVYRVVYRDSNGADVAETTVNDSTLLKPNSWEWLTNLSLSAQVRQEPSKYSWIRNLLRAVIAHHTEGAPVVRNVRSSGLMLLRGQTVYATPAGGVIGAEGVVEALRSTPPISDDLAHYGRIAVEPIEPRHRRHHLAALLETLDAAPGNPALGYTLMADLLAAPLASMYNSARGITYVVGDSQIGKSATVGLFQSLQMPGGLFDEAAKAGADMRAKTKGHGQTTPSGLRSHLAPLAGIMILVDDLTKKAWSGTALGDQALALTTDVAMMTAPGGASPLQATFRSGEGVVAATRENLRGRFVATMEIIPVSGELLEDSAINRGATVWYTESARCDLETWDRLTAEEFRADAHRGWCVWIHWIVSNHEKWIPALNLARKMLAEIPHARPRAVWGARLAPWIMFDQMAAEYGCVLEPFAPRVAAELLAASRLVEEYGCDSVERIASHDPLTGFRLALRSVVTRWEGHFYAPKDFEDEHDLPPEMIDGYAMSRLGWKAAPGETSDAPPLAPGSRSAALGMFTKPAEKDRKTPWPVYVELTNDEWRHTIDVVRERAKRMGYAVADESDLKRLMIEDGKATYGRAADRGDGIRPRVTRISAQWLLLDDPEPLSMFAIDDEDGED